MVLPTSGTISISDINSCARFTNGNMGINTTSPNYNLDINGTLKATTITTGTILATTSVSSGALHATNSTVTNAVSTNVSSGTLNLSTGLTAGTILATTSVSSGALHATNSTVTNAVSTNVSSGTLNLSTGLTAGTILATTSVSSGAVNATNSTVTNSVATNSSISNLVSSNSTIANIFSTVSTIGTLRTDLGVMSDAIMVKASILTSLTVPNLLASTSVSSGALYATNSTVTNAVSTNVSSGTLNLSTGLTSASAQITNSNVTTQTVGTVLVTTNLLATGSSNTLGNIFTTGGSVGIGTTSPATDNGSRLSIVGSAFDGSAGLLRLYPSTFGSKATIGFVSGQTSGSYWNIGRQNASNDFALTFSANTAGMYFLANGNVSCGPLTTTSITAGTIFASNNVNAAQSIVVQNTNSGSSAYSALTVATDQSNFNIFKNSSTRTADGGANTTTIRNDGGPLRLQSNTGMGIWVGSTGNVGINTTTPSAILNVSGDTVIQGGGLTVKNSLFSPGYGSFELQGTAGSYIDFGPDTIDFRSRIEHIESNRSMSFRVNGGTYAMTLASTGNVGIGTASPTAKLNVIGSTDFFGYLRVGASSSSTGFNIDLGTSGVGINRSGYLYGDGTTIYLTNQQNGGLNFGTNNTWDRLHIAANGNISIGGSSGGYKFNVFGSSPSGNVASYAGWYGNYGWQNQTTSYDVSIWSQNFIMSNQGFVSVSDQRIKKDIIEIEDGESLNILRQIQPKRYRYIDEYKRGTDYVYGFIAQQVRGVLPAASGLVKDFIPSIMTPATVSYDSTNDITTVTLVDNKQHNLTSENSNSRVRFVDENDQNTDLELHEIVSGDIFKVKGELKGTNTFAYGVEVDDFHTLNKDAIFTVAVSALQQVDKELQETKQTVNDLLQRIQALENAN